MKNSEILQYMGRVLWIKQSMPQCEKECIAQAECGNWSDLCPYESWIEEPFETLWTANLANNIS